MSEIGDIDADERRRFAEARLAGSRPARDAAAAVHARDITRGEQGGDGMVRKSLAEVAANSRHFTVEERARLLAMTEEEIEAAALADPDNPPWTAEELEQAARERDARLAAAKRSA